MATAVTRRTYKTVCTREVSENEQRNTGENRSCGVIDGSRGRVEVVWAMWRQIARIVDMSVDVSRVAAA